MTGPLDPSTYFRKGFGLKAEVQSDLAQDYHGQIVDYMRAHDYTLVDGELTIRLAREFGFCYGVERAVEYAYQARRKFPDRRILLVGEIIHNPHVNARLGEMGVEILRRRESAEVFDFSTIAASDVVILPAFGVTVTDLDRLRQIGCVLVDTTCGSVLNVWKRVESYARDGFTALIHGKYAHEETRATASQVTKYAGGQYLVVRDMAEARMVCGHIEGSVSGNEIVRHFERAMSPGFDPDRHLQRVGVANQTTMLARESLDIAEEVGAAIGRARGPEARQSDFRSFDTICSATQERQDAVRDLLREPLDVMVVIGGFNSSNTLSLAALCAEQVPTYHVETSSAIDPDRATIHYRPAGKSHQELDRADWLPTGPVRVGVTAGASTPNNKIGDAIFRIMATATLRTASATSL